MLQAAETEVGCLPEAARWARQICGGDGRAGAGADRRRGFRAALVDRLGTRLKRIVIATDGDVRSLALHRAEGKLLGDEVDIDDLRRDDDIIDFDVLYGLDEDDYVMIAQPVPKPVE